MTLSLTGSSVAQLKADDPEGEPLIYGVSGEEAMKYFAVTKETGVVWLRQQLDREVQTNKLVHTHTKCYTHAHILPKQMHRVQEKTHRTILKIGYAA